MALKVNRSGRTENTWHAITTAHVDGGESYPGYVSIHFRTGGDERRSDFKIDLRPDDYAEFLREMARAAPDAFGAAVADIMTDGVREFDRQVKKRSRNLVRLQAVSGG
jgi:hypothetical protein